jgi:hypothetical protein
MENNNIRKIFLTFEGRIFELIVKKTLVKEKMTVLGTFYVDDDIVIEDSLRKGNILLGHQFKAFIFAEHTSFTTMIKFTTKKLDICFFTISEEDVLKIENLSGNSARLHMYEGKNFEIKEMVVLNQPKQIFLDPLAIAFRLGIDDDFSSHNLINCHELNFIRLNGRNFSFLSGHPGDFIETENGHSEFTVYGFFRNSLELQEALMMYKNELPNDDEINKLERISNL